MSSINADAHEAFLVLLKGPAAGRNVPNEIVFTHEAWLTASEMFCWILLILKQVYQDRGGEQQLSIYEKF